MVTFPRPLQPSPVRFRMSLATKGDRISVQAFAAAPPLLELPAIARSDSSVSNVSSFRGAGGEVDLAEGCFLTKAVKYTHRLTHFINVVPSGDSTPVVSRNMISVNLLSPLSFQEDVINRLRIIPYLTHFKVDSPCNLVLRKAWKYVQGDRN